MTESVPHNAADRPPGTPASGISGIVLTYAAFASLWIVLSDQVVEWVFVAPNSITLASTLKGWLFVIITSLLLYGMLQRRHHQLLAQAASVLESQAARQRALSLLESLAESSDDAIFAKDLAGRYILFNRAASRFVGRPAEAVLGRDDRTLFPPDQAEMLMAQGRQVIAENRNLMIEEVLATANGERAFLATKGPLRDGDGKIIGIFGTSRDITEQKAAEARLRASEERLRLSLEASNDGLWDWDLRTGISYRSPRYFEIIGFQPEEATADFEFFRNLVHPEDRPAMLECVEAHKRGETRAIEMDCRIRVRDGAIRWMAVRGQAVERDVAGAPLRMVGTLTDITARKSAEDDLRRQAAELASRNAELERFNRASVGREMDMIGLKQIINELSRQLGLAAPFPLEFLDTPGQPDKTP